ncbi:MAG: tyrosine-type recombinase/integrase [Planctomycetota bacterium]|jgi:integrase
MNTQLVSQEAQEIVVTSLKDMGQAANHVASLSVFNAFRARKSANTLKRYDNDLKHFKTYLEVARDRFEIEGEIGDLANDPMAWGIVTWGLVEKFVEGQLQAGYAVSSTNQRLSTIKVFADLACKAGALEGTDKALIKSVKGYSRNEAININEHRQAVGLPTRYSGKQEAHPDKPLAQKKSRAVVLDGETAQALKEQPDTPQGRRDHLLVCLLLDHGLRISEAVGLQVGDVNTKSGEMTFYRPKTRKTETHKLSVDTLLAAITYIEQDALAAGPLFRGSRKGPGRLTTAGWSTRKASGRIKVLGKRLGVEGLSAHDLRHTSATRLGKVKTTKELMEIFGWASPAMAVRYQEDSKVVEVE